jgi:hypothetical protein
MIRSQIHLTEDQPRGILSMAASCRRAPIVRSFDMGGVDVAEQHNKDWEPEA